MPITLSEDEINFILTVLGDMPTKSNAWPLAQRIMAQVQQAKNPPPPEEPPTPV